MRRLTDERGQVSVVVALLMVPLMGFAAISVDVAALWNQELQLQNGADAAALAIAGDCARGRCGSTTQTAQGLASANIAVDTAAASVTSLTSTSVTVRNTGVRNHWFAPVLGHDSSRITTTATANWQSPIGGTAVLPLTFSWCEFSAQTGGGLPSGTTSRTIYLTGGGSLLGDCNGPLLNRVPGGFGWLRVNSGTCRTTSAILSLLPSDPGNSVPSSCSPQDLVNVRGKTVLLPVHDLAVGNGSNAVYRVYGYAAFVITGYRFGGQYSWNSPCSGNGRCLSGYFTTFVGQPENFERGPLAPRLGIADIRLTR